MADSFTVPSREKGAALLTVLLLVAVMAVISATALDRLRLSTRLAVNGAAMAQARAYNLAAEGIATTRIEDLLANSSGQLTNESNWLDRDIPFPIDQGRAFVRLSDAQNCFNINSLVLGADGKFAANPVAIRQFSKLMELLGIDTSDAVIIAESTVDWIDSDLVPLPSGAEDSHYRGQAQPYLAANRLFTDQGELKSVRGITAAHYARLRPWICALPLAEPVRLNANTLLPDQAILLSAILDGKLAPAEAKALLAIRPPGGYGSAVKFWALPQLAATKTLADVQGQVGVTSEWFFLRTRIAADSIELESRALVAATDLPVRVLWRSWGQAG